MVEDKGKESAGRGQGLKGKEGTWVWRRSSLVAGEGEERGENKEEEDKVERERERDRGEGEIR
jgi:hypothetical protein